MSGEDILAYSMNTTLSLYDSPTSKYKMDPSKPCKQRVNFFRDIDGNSPWQRAVNNPHCSLADVKKLSNLVSIINKKNVLGHTALHCAVISNGQKFDVIEFLIDNGANVNSRDYNGSIPLHKALQNPNCTLQVIDLLINKGSDLSVKQYKYETPFMFAVKSHARNMEIVEKIMYRGCIDICEDHRESHNTMRILCSNPSMIDIVLILAASMDFDVNYEDEYLEEDIIEFSCSNSICGFKTIEGMESKCTDLSTALLLHAVRHPSYNMSIIRRLMDEGGDVYAYNCHRRCALDYALCNPQCSPRLIWEMLRRGPQKQHWQLRVGQKCNTFLHIAVSNRKCSADVIKILLRGDRMEKLNTQNRDGLTPLDCAADLNRGTDCNLDVIETLMINGATTEKDPTVQTVVSKNIRFLGSCAANREALECTKLLFKYVLVEKIGNTLDTYNCLLELIRPYMKRDRNGYFAELNSYLNACLNEIMILLEKKFNHLSYYDFIVYFRCNLGPIDVTLMHEELFWFLVSNLCPLYNSYIVSYLKKKILAENLFEVKIYAPKANGTSIFLNAYCSNYLTQFLQNKDLLNLYVAFEDQDTIKKLTNAGQKWLYRLDDIDWEDPMENNISVVRPKKRCKVD